MELSYSFVSNNRILIKLILLIFVCFTHYDSLAAAKKRSEFDPIAFTILHTNDLHSHFREDTSPLKLGGLARLKTEVDLLRQNIPHSLLVDAGDWSEGNIYYTQGNGTETLKLMDHIGYDIAVIGNHDFINGPDLLLDTLNKSHPRTKFVAANMTAEDYPRQDEFKKWILPYVIREIGKAKIAFIGLTTYEHIFDKYALPVKITNPFDIAEELAAKLKEEVDAVVAISHNSISNNIELLENSPSIDLVISGHQHKKLNKPIEVTKNRNSKGWVVEAECWGRYLGKLDLSVSPEGLELKNYQLIQIDHKIPENKETLSRINKLENVIEQQFGRIHHDEVGTNQLEIHNRGIENYMGNLITDAYLNSVQADFALESTRFIYGTFHPGTLHTVDVFNAIPAIFNPVTKKTWTLRTFTIPGNKLKWILNLIYSTKKLSAYGLLSTSGLSFTFNPLFLKSNSEYNLSQKILDNQIYESPNIQGLLPVKDISIAGEPLNLEKNYVVATGGGLIDAIEFINSNILNYISLDSLIDTGKENWKVLAKYIQNNSPITGEKIQIGSRIRTQQGDLGIYDGDLEWKPYSISNGKVYAKVTARVKNYGLESFIPNPDEEPTKLHLLFNEAKTDTTVDPIYRDLAPAQPIPSLAPGESVMISWNVVLPEIAGMYPVTFKLEPTSNEVNHTNDELTHWFELNR